jgi:acyl-CoA synthetase (AMP-forming)/AMP-acid ligase II
VWTSGTTGRPNGAVYAQRQFAAITAAMGGLTQPDDVRINAIPFAHVGFMTRLHDEFANATTTVIASEPWRAADYLRAVAAERVTVATGVPTQWTLLLDHPDMRTTDLTSLRMAGIGAASIDPALVRRMMDVLGVPVMNRYTSTEAGIGTGTRLGDDPETVTTTVGRPGPGVELVIDAPDERGIGEILFRSPAMMRGYWHDDAQTAATIDTAGFLHTGDLGRIGNDGNLRIVGRRKEMYIRGGYNVYPVEIENVLTTMTGIRAAAVVGVPDPVLGEVGVAFLALDDARNNHVPDLDSVRAWCQARLADYKAPDRLHIIDALPLTPMGKIDKRSLVDRARARRSNP